MTLGRIVLACLLASAGTAAFGCIGASSSLGGGGGGGGDDGGGGTSSACDQYFDAYIAADSCDVALPASEVTRLRAIFEGECAAELALPGTALTGAALIACAQAVDVSPCAPGDPSACDVTPAGTLPVGAACLTGTQCETAYCKFTFIDDDGGSSYESSCGTCADTIGAGESCASGDTPCAPGTACSGAPNPTCVAVTYGGAGDACDDTALVCNEGLFCQTTTMTCSAPGAAGARCTGSPDCATGLVCAAGACAVGATAGETCTSTVVCAQGLTCELPTGTCVAITWASAGAPCSNAAQCLVGGCNQGTTFETNTCPTVVADGEPCPIDGASTCDTFSQCVNGVCALPTAATCN